MFLRGFLSSVASQKDGAMMQAERGAVTLSQVGEDVSCFPSRLLLLTEADCVCEDDSSVRGRVCEGGPGQGSDSAV